MEAIVLAGGAGTRLRAAVPDLPKPMAPIAGRPFLEYLLDYWAHEGIHRFILSTGYKHEAIESRFGVHYKKADIDYAREHRPLGTGGGLILAASTLRDDAPFLVLNGDTFFRLSLKELTAAHREKGADMTVALRAVKENTRYGSVDIDTHGRIRSFKGPKETSGGEKLINGGVYVMTRSLLSIASVVAGETCSFEEDLFPRFLAGNKKCMGLVSPAPFIDIGIPEDYRAAEKILLST